MAADDGSGTLTIARPVETFEQLCEVFLPTVAARIWAACCWPKGMGNGWNIGDYRFAVIAVSPEPKTSLHVQFWSEPGEEVLMEVCSGEWSPSSVKYVQQPQRELLRTLGFRIGGEARNFRKELFITKVSEAEAAARETLRILFDGFRFRGQWPLEIRVERPGARSSGSCTRRSRLRTSPNFSASTVTCAASTSPTMRRSRYCGVESDVSKRSSAGECRGRISIPSSLSMHSSQRQWGAMPMQC